MFIYKRLFKGGMKQKISITLNEKTITEIDSIVDNIYIRNRSQAIEHLVSSALGENKVAVILFGGSEEKLRIGKEYRITARVRQKSLVEMAVRKLRESEFKTIFLIARRKVLTRVFEILGDGSSYGVKINYSEEKESRGTSDSLKLLRGKVKSTFLVIYGDIWFSNIHLEELWKHHLKQHSVATLMLTTSAEPSHKGTVNMEGSKILSFIQKPKKSDVYLVFSPIFAAEPEIMEYEGESLERSVFPQLAEKGILEGHISSQKEIHIHKKDDAKKIP